MKRAIAVSLAALLIGAGPLAAGGCASMPEPCTSEWVDWKTERFIGAFVHDHQEAVRRPRGTPPTHVLPERRAGATLPPIFR